MPRLIGLNGPPGIGKSTVAQRFVDEHPMTLSLEKDLVRGLLADWRSRRVESGLLAHERCLAMARVHLVAGRDVVVPQFVADPEYLDRFSALTREVDAECIEFALHDELSSAESRFHARLAHQYERLSWCLAGRRFIEVDSVQGDVEGTYLCVLAHLQAT